jgi:adenylate cyclase
MRIGVRPLVACLVLLAIGTSTASVHAIWWRTAERTSLDLAATINQQIVALVTQQLTAITSEARAAHTAIRTLFLQNVLETKEADKREFVFLSQIQAQPTISWVAFGWPDGNFFGSHKLGNTKLEMTEISEIDGKITRRTDQYVVVSGDIQFEERRFEGTSYSILEQPWYVQSMQAEEPRWYQASYHPTGSRPAIAFAGPIDVYQKREGALAVIIEYSRLSRLLAQLAVGKTGAAFLFDRDGRLIAAPDGNSDEVNMPRDDQPLLSVASAAIRQGGSPMGADRQQLMLTADNEMFDIALNRLEFLDWTLAVVIPEKEILGPVRATLEQIAIWIAGLIVVAGALSAWVAQRIIAAPLLTIGAEMKNVKLFELERVTYRPSAVAEMDDLSRTITDMAAGLSAFGKYIPADLVRALIKQGVGAQPGVTLRTMTVMFVDLAGFTGLSERMGDKVLPILSEYFDCVSSCVADAGGTIDKFIGDAVMAFWGAPTNNPRHAHDACRCALAIQRKMTRLKLADDSGRPLRVRIGVNSGHMLVGNIGSRVRLNYTVIGDAVNVASRLEGTNKDHGTLILIGEATMRLANDEIVTRRIDEVEVRGRAQPLRIFELLDFRDGDD